MTIPYHSEFAPNGSMDPSTYILNYLDDLQKPIALILASNFGLQGIRIKTIWNHSTQVEHTLKFSQSNVLPKSENTCAPAAGQNPRTCVSFICCETRLKSTTFMRIPLAGDLAQAPESRQTSGNYQSFPALNLKKCVPYHRIAKQPVAFQLHVAPFGVPELPPVLFQESEVTEFRSMRHILHGTCVLGFVCSVCIV